VTSALRIARRDHGYSSPIDGAISHALKRGREFEQSEVYRLVVETRDVVLAEPSDIRLASAPVVDAAAASFHLFRNVPGAWPSKP
jgi:hypothetical protein